MEADLAASGHDEAGGGERAMGEIQGLDLSDLDKISGGAGADTKEVLTIDPYGNIVPMSEEKKNILIKTMSKYKKMGCTMEDMIGIANNGRDNPSATEFIKSLWDTL